MLRLFVIIAVLTLPAGVRADFGTLRHSIFKIDVLSVTPNERQPWLNGPAHEGSGSGFYIGEGRILTNAHVVSNSRHITVQRDGSPIPVQAYVAFIAHDCDLALLKVDKADYFKGVAPLVLGGVPVLRSPVSTVGYPSGGEQISVTKGIVSRLSYRRYVHSSYFQHLLIQVDSAINPGNSGGPVLQGDTVVGMAFQTFRNRENTAYMIPTPVIQRFLTDIRKGTYSGHPSIGITVRTQEMSQPANRAFLGVPQEQGVRVLTVDSDAEWQKLIPGDVLLKIDGRPIGVDGRVAAYQERIDFRIIPDLKQVGQTVDFALIRDRKPLTVRIMLPAVTNPGRKGLTFAKRPRYIVYGGLVFAEFTRNFLQQWGSEWAQKAPLLLKYIYLESANDEAMGPYQDFAVLAKRLPNEVNEYAAEFENAVVRKVDSEPVWTFAAFAKAIKARGKPTISIEFWGNDEPLILDRFAIEKANGPIAQAYGVSPTQWLGPVTDGAITQSEIQ